MIVTKRCSKCGSEFPATLEFFHRDKRLKSGLKAECKGCSNHQLKQFRADHPQKIKEYSQKYAESRRELLASKARQRYQQNRDLFRVYNARWKSRYPEKYKAQSAVHYAVKKGLLPHPSTLPCAVQTDRCRGQASEYHHHHGYDEAHKTDVIAVCSVCHKAAEGVRHAVRSYD